VPAVTAAEGGISRRAPQRPEGDERPASVEIRAGSADDARQQCRQRSRPLNCLVPGLQPSAPLFVRELAQVICELRSDGMAILLIEQDVRLAEEVADEINVM
jgi:hypothetical protein